MAHPKRKQSKTRTAKRRTHDKAVAPTLVLCPNCGALYVANADITEEKWQSKKRLLSNREPAESIVEENCPKCNRLGQICLTETSEKDNVKS